MIDMNIEPPPSFLRIIDVIREVFLLPRLTFQLPQLKIKHKFNFGSFVFIIDENLYKSAGAEQNQIYW